jgi:hypothetical protein
MRVFHIIFLAAVSLAACAAAQNGGVFQTPRAELRTLSDPKLDRGYRAETDNIAMALPRGANEIFDSSKSGANGYRGSATGWDFVEGSVSVEHRTHRSTLLEPGKNLGTAMDEYAAEFKASIQTGGQAMVTREFRTAMLGISGIGLEYEDAKGRKHFLTPIPAAAKNLLSPATSIRTYLMPNGSFARPSVRFS